VEQLDTDQGGLTEEITKLKLQPGKDIAISGSAKLVRSLLQEALLDELRLMVHPVVVGSGKRLFEDGGERRGRDSRKLTTNDESTSINRPSGRCAALRSRLGFT
jgi:dihydrofolate reductase